MPGAPVMLMNYGQPLNAISQISYFVEDLAASMRSYVDGWGIGPWYVLEPFTPTGHLYRGRPSSLSISVAAAFSGSMMIELVQQHDDGPSVYRDTKPGFGFHHVGIMTDRYDEMIAGYLARGYEQVFTDTVRGGRLCYIDTSSDLPGMTEVMEYSSAIEALQTGIYAGSVNWDGSDPIRPLIL